MMASSGAIHFAFVDQAMNTLSKVREYIDAGMETTITVALDMIGEDREAESALTDIDKAKLSELNGVMLDYVRMENELKHYVDAVAQTKNEASSRSKQDTEIDLLQILDANLATLEATDTDEALYQHSKYQELVNLQGGLESEAASTATLAPAQTDLDIEFTQQEISTQCPYTGVEMVHPVRNKHCRHNYDKAGIMEYIKNKGRRARCPVGGCVNDKPITSQDLEDNRELKHQIERKNRKKNIK